MTKRRPPCSYEQALERIGKRIGWARVAALAGHRNARAVRFWSDPDWSPAAGAAISLDLAARLDLAWRAAGGDGFPLLECHALTLEAAAAGDVAGELAVARCLAVAAKEGGEATAAGIEVTLSGDCAAARANALVQTAEAVSAYTIAHVAIRALCGDTQPSPVPR